MGNRTTLLVLLLVLCHGVAMAKGLWRNNDEKKERKEGHHVGYDRKRMFMMMHSKRVVKSDAGEMRVLESYGGKIMDKPMHIGFIQMERRSLFIPQYLDSTLIMFVHEGEAKVGMMFRDKLSETRLNKGDVYRIPAGSAFYMVNIGEGDQNLHIICSIDPSGSIGIGTMESFYIGGGANPSSILSGFEPEILESAFNATGAELKKIFTRQHEGPIVHIDESHDTSLWSKFLHLKEEDKLLHLKKMVQDQGEFDDDDEVEEEKQKRWSWRKLLDSVLFNDKKKSLDKVTHKSTHSCNLYDRKPDFRNRHGWSVTLDGSDYHPLRRSDIGLYHVNLSAGAMMTPHVNPRATEYGIVLRGSGRIQIVFPNGSNAMDTHIRAGDVFFVPIYFPVCQIASRNESLEFFGFTTSAKKNRPQLLVGATSLMRTMMGPELAAAFGVSEETMRRVVEAQNEAVILPTQWSAANEHKSKEEEVKEESTISKLIRNGMIMGF